MTEKQTELIAKVVVSALICALCAAAIYWSGGSTGLGWAILGLIMIWN